MFLQEEEFVITTEVIMHTSLEHIKLYIITSGKPLILWGRITIATPGDRRLLTTSRGVCNHYRGCYGE